MHTKTTNDVDGLTELAALGLTDGGVIIFERQESQRKWGCDKLKNCKSFEELKEARTRNKELFEQTKEENKKQYEETLDSQTMKEEMVKEASVKIAEMFAQYTKEPPIPPPY
ncbi:hypothetical protein Tco_0920744 [Tanacetum coccineum]